MGGTWSPDGSPGRSTCCAEVRGHLRAIASTCVYAHTHTPPRTHTHTHTLHTYTHTAHHTLTQHTTHSHTDSHTHTYTHPLTRTHSLVPWIEAQTLKGNPLFSLDWVSPDLKTALSREPLPHGHHHGSAEPRAERPGKAAGPPPGGPPASGLEPPLASREAGDGWQGPRSPPGAGGG